MAERATELYDAAALALKGHGTPQEIAEIYYAMGSQARLAGDSRRALAILERAASELPPNEVRARAMLRRVGPYAAGLGRYRSRRHRDREAAAVADLPIYQNALGYAALNAASPMRSKCERRISPTLLGARARPSLARPV